MRRQAFKSEGTTDANTPGVNVWPVVHELLLSVASNGATDVGGGLPGLNVGIRRYRFQSNVVHALVDESLLDVIGHWPSGDQLPRQFLFLLSADVRVSQEIEGIHGGHQSLPCNRKGNS